jgi:hypothetical protein
MAYETGSRHEDTTQKIRSDRGPVILGPSDATADIPGLSAWERHFLKVCFPTQSCLNHFADMVSAFENGRAGQDRPQWARSSQLANTGMAAFEPLEPQKGRSRRHSVTAVLDPLETFMTASPASRSAGKRTIRSCVAAR